MATITASSALKLGRAPSRRLSGTERKIHSATAHESAHSTQSTPRHPSVGSAACAGVVVRTLPSAPITPAMPLMFATCVGANHCVFALSTAISPAETPMPSSKRARTKPGRPSASANTAKPAAATRPKAAWTRRGPMTSSATPSGSCATA